MSTFGDYKTYKKYEPLYSNWKNQRDMVEAKRAEYLRLNPDKVNQEDLQRGKALIRAIDIMDEYSQKRAENMEIATETAVSYGTWKQPCLSALLWAVLSVLCLQ